MGADQVEVLFIGGRSGVGKSTVSAEVCVRLEAAGIAHVQLEGDFLGQVFPLPRGTPTGPGSCWTTSPRSGTTSPRSATGGSSTPTP
ncbi:adenylyl-sulfate kinase [Catellatospora coxensis]